MSIWLATAATLALAAADPAPYQWHLPRGFPAPAVPADNPMLDAKVALGRRLFFETRLSVTRQYSCASCHDPARAYSDGRARAVGATGSILPHGAMSLVNVAYNISFGWSRPELRSLESQMRVPLFNAHPVEMGLAGAEGAVCDLLAGDPEYLAAFNESFPLDPAPVTIDHVIKAIAAFERTLIFGDSPFDRYVFQGDHDAITRQAKRGMALFYSSRSGCGSCHSGFNFEGNWRDSKGETGPPRFDGRFRVPTLRNIALTAPYMHDGRFETLGDVIDHHAGGSRLSPRQREDLIAFLEALTDAELARTQVSAGR